MKKQMNTQQGPDNATSAPHPKRSWQRALSLLGIALLAGVTFAACQVGAPVQSHGDVSTTASGSPNGGTDTHREDPSEMPKVAVDWGFLELQSPVKLHLMWLGKLVFTQQTANEFTVWTTSHRPGRDEKVKKGKLLTQKGELRNFAVRQGELLMLYSDNGSMVLKKGYIEAGEMKWFAIRTYDVNDEFVPVAMYRMNDEIYLFGKNHMKRIDWDTNEVIQLPKKLPGMLQQVTCFKSECVAILHNNPMPVRLTHDYEWQTIELYQKSPKNDAQGSSAALDDGGIVNDAVRRVELHKDGLLYTSGNKVFFTCDLRKQKAELDKPEKTSMFTLINGVMMGLSRDGVALTRGEKPAVLEMPHYLTTLKKDEYKLTYIQSVGGYILLENDEPPTGHKRYSLAYQPSLAADLACN